MRCSLCNRKVIQPIACCHKDLCDWTRGVIARPLLRRGMLFHVSGYRIVRQSSRPIAKLHAAVSLHGGATATPHPFHPNLDRKRRRIASILVHRHGHHQRNTTNRYGSLAMFCFAQRKYSTLTHSLGYDTCSHSLVSKVNDAAAAVFQAIELFTDDLCNFSQSSEFALILGSSRPLTPPDSLFEPTRGSPTSLAPFYLFLSPFRTQEGNILELIRPMHSARIQPRALFACSR